MNKRPSLRAAEIRASVADVHCPIQTLAEEMVELEDENKKLKELLGGLDCNRCQATWHYSKLNK